MQYIYRAITPAVERGAEYFPVIQFYRALVNSFATFTFSIWLE